MREDLERLFFLKRDLARGGACYPGTLQSEKSVTGDTRHLQREPGEQQPAGKALKKECGRSPGASLLLLERPTSLYIKSRRITSEIITPKELS